MSLYPYYAGFDEAFVESWINLIQPKQGETVLDPWNGSGTTTTVCGRHGIKSVGIDINPFMRAVASARAATANNWQTIADCIDARNYRFPSQRALPTETCLQLFAKVFGEFDRDVEEFWLAIFLVGSSIRHVAKSAISKNPTWFSRRKLDEVEISGRELFNVVKSQSQMLLKGAASSPIVLQRPVLITSDLMTAHLGEAPTHILTSPPYLTRIDYVQKTLPETRFATELMNGEIVELRKKMMGSVLTSRAFEIESGRFSPETRRILNLVKRHPTKASSTYYYRFYSKYFHDLHTAITKISNAVRPTGTVTFVTQGSYYKEIFVDLPAIVQEIMESRGWELKIDSSFRASNSLIQVNRRTYASTQSPPDEVVQIFGRQS